MYVPIDLKIGDVVPGPKLPKGLSDWADKVQCWWEVTADTAVPEFPDSSESSPLQPHELTCVCPTCRGARADDKVRRKQERDADTEKNVDNAAKLRKSVAKEANTRSKKFGDMDQIKAAREEEARVAKADRVAKTDREEAERVAKARTDRLNALTAGVVPKLAEPPFTMKSIGIPNLACTCYFNTIFQVLF
ncbi:hypothetical protein T484DRAFT_1755506 [Baffinella frigidus]|nr:hypothetical protein T484DRAFT_1755506 [Cryptophyta sp. CCMP2293]